MTDGKRRRRTRSEGRVPLSHSVMAVSNRVLTVCGCRRIEGYAPNEIRLELREMRLAVSGEELVLGTGCGDVIEIRGRISAVAFTDK